MSLQLITELMTQEYNQREQRKAAFWKDHYPGFIDSGLSGSGNSTIDFTCRNKYSSYNPGLITAFRSSLRLAERFTFLDIAMYATGMLTQPDADEDDEDCADLHRVKRLIQQ